MFPYFTIFFILALLACTSLLKIKHNQRTALFVLCILMLWLFAGLRGAGFPDYSAYQMYFLDLRQGIISLIVATEPGFIVINTVIGWFTDDSVWLFLVMSLLAVSINLKCYRDYTPFYFIAAMAYFSHTYLGRELMQIRAGVAAAIALYAYRFIVTSEFKKFFFWVVMAATIHLGSLCVLVVYPISKMRITRRMWYTILGICLLIGFVSPLGGWIRLLPQVEWLTRVQGYAEDSRYSSDLGILTNPTLLKQLMLSFVGLRFFSVLSQKVWGYNVFLTSYLIATCWLILWNDFAILSARVATFFSVTEVVLLGSYTYLFEKNSRWIYLLWVILLTLTMLCLNILGDKLPIYHTIFS